MSSIKLARLPDTTPTKQTIQMTPALGEALAAYADFYNEAYGTKATSAELIPAMLENFLESDRAFQAARRKRVP